MWKQVTEECVDAASRRNGCSPHHGGMDWWMVHHGELNGKLM